MSLHLNPEYDKLLPQMSEEEFAELKRSIQTEGQHYPIIVNGDLEVLDGHHRFRACTELGIEPDFEVKQFDDKLLEKKFVIEANLRRRHLNNFQLVELAVPLLEIERALAKKRQSKGGKNGRDVQLGLAQEEDADPLPEPEIKSKATEVVAKKAGVSARTLERGKKILEKASEDEKQKLREGKTSISRVYQEIVNEEKPKPTEPPAPKVESEHDLHNKAELLAILECLLSEELFCPSCGNAMFECSKCHKTLKELLKAAKNESHNQS
ncbi:MAG: ParB N-terminal domain-containing protein [Candidatus Bathyarchaeota archaeon]|nr:ParB N-terminal domain-containing protein [Candidatus Bathyarchaeota archaeon]